MDDSFMDLLFVSDDGLTYGYDTTGDGQVDTISGMAETDRGIHYYNMFDTNGDGIMDTMTDQADTDYDGVFDMLSIARDYDGDGVPDYAKMFMDATGDGDANAVVTYHADNSDPSVDGRLEVDIDLDGDHVADIHEERFIPADEPIFDATSWDIPMAGNMIGSPLPDGRFDPDTPADQVAGTPADDMEVWECQGPTNRCALYSQKFVIEQLSDPRVEIDIEEFARTAAENGWFTEENGTNGLNMDKMLDYYGVDHDVVYDSDLQSLEEALRNGEKVIVSVDSGQIWYGHDNDIFSPATGADHALQVIGIDYSDPDAPMVVLNDSGSPAGCGEMVPLDVFENAWGAGDHQMIVCRA